jgi:hypothetical protein
MSQLYSQLKKVEGTDIGNIKPLVTEQLKVFRGVYRITNILTKQISAFASSPYNKETSQALLADLQNSTRDFPQIRRCLIVTNAIRQSKEALGKHHLSNIEQIVTESIVTEYTNDQYLKQYGKISAELEKFKQTGYPNVFQTQLGTLNERIKAWDNEYANRLIEDDEL